MTIAEKIQRAREDIENAYNRGYAAGGGTLEPEYKIVTPSLDYQMVFPSIGCRLTGVTVKSATEVHDAAYASGHSQGITDERTAFWNVFQNNGEPMSYFNAFAYNRFSDETYNPIHDIVCKEGGANAGHMFYYNTLITNTKVPIIVGNNDLDFAFSYCYNLEKIVLLNVGELTTYIFAFDECKSLTYIRFEGTIGDDISFADCPLDVESAWSVYEAIADFSIESGTTKTLTFSKTTQALLDVPKYDEDGNEMDSDWVEMQMGCDFCGWVLEVAG